MDDEEGIKELCGCGEPMDEFTAASLGITDLQINQANSTRLIKEELREGWSKLMFAIHYHRKDIIKHLIEQTTQHKTYQINDSRDETTARCLAVLSADLNTLQLLHSAGILEETDVEGKTALFLAVETNQPLIVENLLANGAAVNTTCGGRSCLGEAARQGNTNLIRLLLKYSACVVTHNETCTPLNLALESGNMQAVYVLLQHITQNYKLEELFKQINMEKYWKKFEQNNIGYKEFLNMSEADLKNNGISVLGPRKKLACLISLLNSTVQN